MGGSTCELAWAARQQTCPYGSAHLSVTWPKDMDGVQMLAVFYSYVPWGLGAWGFLSLLVRRGTRELNFMFFTGITVFLAEIVLKNVFLDPRPPHSCNLTCGMPSSHATLAIGFLTLRLLDVLLRARPRLHPTQTSSRQAHEPVRGVDEDDASQPSSAVAQLFSALPVASTNEHTIVRHCVHLFLWAVILAPVTWSRIKVEDHKLNQVVDGSILGFSLAVLWWAGSLVVQRKYNHRLGCPALAWRSRTLILHDHALPCYMAIARCSTGAQDAEAGDASTPKLSLGPVEELSWYAGQAERRGRELQLGCAASLSSAEVEFCRSRAAELRELARLAKERQPASCRSSAAEAPPGGQPLLVDGAAAPGHARPPSPALTSPALSEGGHHTVEQYLTLRAGGASGGVDSNEAQSFEVQSFEIERQRSREGRHFFQEKPPPDVPENHGIHEDDEFEVESLPSTTDL